MIEIAFALTQTLTILFLLYYVYKLQKDSEIYRQKVEQLLINIPKEINELHTRLTLDREKRLDKTLEKTFGQYIKHIRDLERMAIPNKPVTTKMVQSILDAGNDIENPDVESVPVTERNIGDIVAMKPKIVFEGNMGDTNEITSDIIE